jgi:hypothetical protein
MTPFYRRALVVSKRPGRARGTWTRVDACGVQDDGQRAARGERATRAGVAFKAARGAEPRPARFGMRGAVGSRTLRRRGATRRAHGHDAPERWSAASRRGSPN